MSNLAAGDSTRPQDRVRYFAILAIAASQIEGAAMTHDPALEAHEHAEHAEHAAHEHDPFISRVAITVAVLAVLAAVAGSLETVEGDRALASSSEAVLNQNQATDAWGEYEADSIKGKLFAVAADAVAPHAADYKKQAKAEGDKRGKLSDKAKAFESKRDDLIVESRKHENRHDRLTVSATLLEIGIALSTVAIITRRSWLWGTATLFGCLGVALLVATYAL